MAGVASTAADIYLIVEKKNLDSVWFEWQVWIISSVQCSVSCHERNRQK